MTNKWEVTLDIDEEEADLLYRGLEELEGGPAAKIVALKSKITLAQVEAEFRDESDAYNDWVNREMYGKEVKPDPDVVVRHVDGRDVVVRRRIK